MRSKTMKRVLSIAITVLMLAALLPAAAFAESEGYVDVAKDAGYAAAANYLREKGYMIGVSDNEFAPDVSLTRAMAITVLYRVAGEPAVAEAVDFTDVASDTWYTDAVAWGAEKGIVVGDGNGIFSPDRALSEAEANLMIARYQSAAASGDGRTAPDTELEIPEGSAEIMSRAGFAIAVYTLTTESATYDLDVSALMGKWEYVTEAPKSERGAVVLDENGNPVMEPVDPPCYALKNVVYCASPADASVQKMDIYVPAEYVNAVDNGDGTYTVSVKEDGSHTNSDGVTYTGKTAPVIYQNTVDGYAQGDMLALTSSRRGQGVGTYQDYLKSGYVLVCIGTRGVNSTVDGTAPAVVVDLKAGVRYLKKNAELLPGDMEKIVATGVSAGGAVTAALGASGNSPLFLPYLESIGAAMDATDDVYAAMPFCPITNLEYGNSAYEWLHDGETSRNAGGFGGVGGGPGGNMGGNMGAGPGGNMGAGPGGDMGGGASSKVEFTAFELAYHDALVEAYKEDLTSFGLDPEQFAADFLQAINDCIADYVENHYDGTMEAFAAENPALTFADGKVAAPDIHTYVADKMARNNGVPKVDNLDGTATENKLFDGKHFNAESLAVLEKLASEYTEAAEVLDSFKADLTEERLAEVALMSPLNFILNETERDIAPFWRVQNGGTDGDLGAVAGFTIAQLLQKNGLAKQVDFAFIWGVGHMAADYSYADVQTYVDSICK